MDRTLYLNWGRFTSDIGKNVSIERIVNYCNRLLREVVESQIPVSVKKTCGYGM